MEINIIVPNDITIGDHTSPLEFDEPDVRKTYQFRCTRSPLI